MRTLITSSIWNDKIAELANSALSSLKERHPETVIVTDSGDVHIKIAEAAADHGFQVHLFYPNVKKLDPPALMVAMQITIATAGVMDFYAFMFQRVDNVIALAEGDPLIEIARRSGKPIWFPASGKVVEGFKI